MPDALISAERPAMRASAVAAPSTANVSLVTIRFVRLDAPAGVNNAFLYLSDSPLGAGLTAVTATGAIVAGASGLLIGADVVAKKYFNIQTTAQGLFILSITDTAKTPFVVCLVIEGRTYVVATLTAANYG